MVQRFTAESKGDTPRRDQTRPCRNIAPLLSHAPWERNTAVHIKGYPGFCETSRRKWRPNGLGPKCSPFVLADKNDDMQEIADRGERVFRKITSLSRRCQYFSGGIATSPYTRQAREQREHNTVFYYCIPVVCVPYCGCICRGLLWLPMIVSC